jgi:NO-binding membrane sensor protein with MHYT domain
VEAISERPDGPRRVEPLLLVLSLLTLVTGLTTTVLTLTLTGLAADSWLAGGRSPRVGRRVAAVGLMAAGALVGQLEYDRVVFFSDAVFAIAITLLIVDLQVPEVAHVESGRQLRDALPQIGGFALSFAVIRLSGWATTGCSATSRA